MPATRPPDCDAVRRTHRPQSAKRTFRSFSNEELKLSLGAIPKFPRLPLVHGRAESHPVRYPRPRV